MQELNTLCWLCLQLRLNIDCIKGLVSQHVHSMMQGIR